MRLRESDVEKLHGQIEPLHRFHCYSARFPSKLALAAVQDLTKPGQWILDPFAGSGTTLVAGLALKRRVAGADIDPLACLLTWAKLHTVCSNDYAAFADRFQARLKEAFCMLEQHSATLADPVPGKPLGLESIRFDYPEFPELAYWFPPRIAQSLAVIAAVAQRVRTEPYRSVALAALSASIISKWPNTLSAAMDVDHTRPHRIAGKRIRPSEALERYWSRFERTANCLGRLDTVYRERGIPDSRRGWVKLQRSGDARRLTSYLEEESIDAVITSPPYFNAVDYPRAHRLSLCWLDGLAPEDYTSRRQYIGLRFAAEIDEGNWLASHPEIRIPADLRQDKGLLRRIVGYFHDLEVVLQQIYRVLRPGGCAMLVIANNRVRGRLLRSDEAIIDHARRTGFALQAQRARKIEPTLRRFPVGPFGFDGPMTNEHVIVLKRPKRRARRDEL